MKTPATTLGAFFDRLSRFEGRLEKWYGVLRDKTPDNRVALLTYYLCRHNRRLPEMLADLPPAEANRLCRAKCAADIDRGLAQAFSVMRTPPRKVTGQELLRSAFDYQSRLCEILGILLGETRNKRVSAFLGKFTVLERRDLVKLRKMMATGYF